MSSIVHKENGGRLYNRGLEKTIVSVPKIFITMYHLSSTLPEDYIVLPTSLR